MPETGGKTQKPAVGFQKGNPGGPGRGKKKPVLLGSFVFDDLNDAYTKPSDPGDRPGVKMARQMFTDDYKTFMSLYLQGMKERREAASDARAGEAGEKEERLDELLESLLSGFEASTGGAK